MYKHPDLTQRRISACIQEIEGLIYGPSVTLTIEAAEVRGEPITIQEALTREYAPFSVGGAWGSRWGTTWFKFTGTVPADWAGRHVVALVSLGFLGGEGFTVEGLIWQNGKPVRALNVHRQDVEIASRARGGESFEFYVEAAANPISPTHGKADLLMPDPDGPHEYKLTKAELTCFHREFFDLFYDIKAAYETMMMLPTESPRRGELLYGLNEAVNEFDLQDAATVPAARGIVRRLLQKRNGDTNLKISAVGHAHIDTAWLWPLRETMRKCARTFSTALDYMEQYPDYVFACSQAQQYAWMKQHYPDIYARIKAAVKRGQWEAIGSMWIEADCNLSSGESLVRQILYGKKFFQEELGVETVDVWIPDVFGYSASMPQIMKKARVKYFLTQKISWNQFNQFPHHTFNWEGIDGTRIFTHFPPANGYSSDFSVRDVAFTSKNFKEHDRASRALYVYGHGDGGGGPTKGMLEIAGRLKNLEGVPEVTLEKVADFFPKAVEDARDLPLWVGELYLELHRGTYTSQAANKRGNRKGESLLRAAELFDALTRGVGRTIDYAPAEIDRAAYDVVGMEASARTVAGDLERAWKLLLLNQFHDIIPGSSIHWVYEDSKRDYDTITKLGDSVCDAAQQAIAAQIDTNGFAAPVIVFNALAQSRTEVVTLPSGRLEQITVLPCGYVTVDAESEGLAPSTPVTVQQTANGTIVLDNGLLRVTIDKDGLIPSIVDLRANREVVEEGRRANLLQLHEDKPADWSAWDVDLYYREKFEDLTAAESVEVLAGSSLRAVVEVRRSFGSSTLRQRIVLDAGSPRIDFETEVDWNEDRKLLKAAFPVEIRSARATYEIQYGHTERPTHYNTSWDLARFEVCAQKWADLAEPGYGVALLNDCKYGHDIFGNVMRLSLLRAPTAPDPMADRGHHRFTYSLLPHAGDFREAGVIEQAYALNNPLQIVATTAAPGAAPATHSYFHVDQPGVIIESIKTAEDGDGVIVRLYEAYGGRRSVRVSSGLAVQSVALTDLLETEVEALRVADNSVTLALKPFEIVTLRFRPGA